MRADKLRRTAFRLIPLAEKRSVNLHDMCGHEWRAGGAL